MMKPTYLIPQPSIFYATVQSYERFESGNSFEVRCMDEQSLGVCNELFSRKGFTSPYPSNGDWQMEWSAKIWNAAQIR